MIAVRRARKVTLLVLLLERPLVLEVYCHGFVPTEVDGFFRVKEKPRVRLPLDGKQRYGPI